MTAVPASNVVQDHRLPGLNALLDPEFVLARLGAHLADSAFRVQECVVKSVRYRAGSSCIAWYVVTGRINGDDKPRELWWSGRCFTKANFAAECAEASATPWTRPAFGDAVIPVPHHHLMLFAYPNDRRLKGLEMLLREDLLADCLRRHPGAVAFTQRKVRARIIRYKPEQRAVVRCDTESSPASGELPASAMFLRIFPDQRGLLEFQTMRALAGWLPDHGDLAIPQPLGFDTERCALLAGSVPGSKLKLAVRTDGAPQALERIASALATLHAFDNPRIPRRSCADHLRKAELVILLLNHLTPQFRTRLVEIGRLMATKAPADNGEQFGFTHGDFHCGQVLIDSVKIGFVDFERAHHGPVMFDLGTWLASCRARRIAGKWGDEGTLTSSFLSAYAKASQRPLPAAKVSWWTALALLQMAAKPIRRLDADAPIKIERLLDEVILVLRGG